MDGRHVQVYEKGTGHFLQKLKDLESVFIRPCSRECQYDIVVWMADLQSVCPRFDLTLDGLVFSGPRFNSYILNECACTCCSKNNLS